MREREPADGETDQKEQPQRAFKAAVRCARTSQPRPCRLPSPPRLIAVRLRSNAGLRSLTDAPPRAGLDDAATDLPA